MNTKDIMVLGLGLQEPWRLVGQHLDTANTPKVLQLEIAADTGAKILLSLSENVVCERPYREK